MAENALQSVSHQRLSGDEIQITFEFSDYAPAPQSFTIANPARISLDFPNVTNNMAYRNHDINIGQTRSVSLAESSDRTRAVVNLSSLISYDMRTEGNLMIMTLSPSGSYSSAPVAATQTDYQEDYQYDISAASVGGPAQITNVDFRRGTNGSGRILLTLSDPTTPINIRQQGSNIIVDLLEASVSTDLQRRLDVVDFGTPVESISITGGSTGSQVSVKASGNYTHLAYQTDNLYTIEVKPRTDREIEQEKRRKNPSMAKNSRSISRTLKFARYYN